MPIRSTLEKAQLAEIEKQAMRVSLIVTCFGFAANIFYGLLIQSDALLLTAIIYLLNLATAGLGVLAATLVNSPASQRHEHGYWFLEPLVNGISGVMILLVCAYGLINGIEGIRTGGHYVYTRGVVWFTAGSCLVCLVMVRYKLWASKKVNSKLLKTDSWKWVIKLAFSAATMAGFLVYSAMPDHLRDMWSRYIDSAVTIVLSLIFVGVALKVIGRSFGELLHVPPEENNPTDDVRQLLSDVGDNAGILRFHTHVIQIGRLNSVDICILIDADSELRNVRAQDALRERIWSVTNRQPIGSRVTVQISADPNWEDGRHSD
ncbi:cation diffusion facilitator family transporter [Pandoraea pnomenusa]|uniref:cation diffusion facilitator family transporter n=1 Tax=Pandoraea pnomenusa TaxID=93220 RepID=UPI003340F396